MILKGKRSQKRIRTYFDFFEKGNSTISALIDSARNVNPSLFRYLPINYTFEDMQSSGNTNLLDEEQRRALIELSNEQEFLKIVIEKVVSNYFVAEQEFRKYMDQDISTGDFFKTLKIIQDEQTKTQGLLHQHNMLSILYSLGEGMERRGVDIKVKTNKALNLLKKKEN